LETVSHRPVMPGHAKAGRILCGAFQGRSRAVWRLIRRGQAAGIRAAEETITNLTLIELGLVRDPQFFVLPMSRSEESITGADWEMWFGSVPGPWLGVRLQAKAIDLASFEFRHLHYRPHGAPFQCDTLIRSALAKNPPRVPLYLLYTYAPRGYLTDWPCGSYSPKRDWFGCSVVSAFQVRLLRLAGHKRQKNPR
jgi:hypothetical protein